MSWNLFLVCHNCRLSLIKRTAEEAASHHNAQLIFYQFVVKSQRLFKLGPNRHSRRKKELLEDQSGFSFLTKVQGLRLDKYVVASKTENILHDGLLLPLRYIAFNVWPASTLFLMDEGVLYRFTWEISEASHSRYIRPNAHRNVAVATIEDLS